ncbi:MAG: hypothetical protein M1831_007253 [Alyxoria varia]|nr:MAG: hypothetical protein M1831_007253 [Alyxoria varia]
MEDSESTTIADLSTQSKKKFLAIGKIIRKRCDAKSQQLLTVEGFDPQEFSDLFARFRVWSGNLGALQRNNSSLDYRLRNSDIRSEVIRLLTQLLSALNDLTPIIDEEREQESWYAGPWRKPDRPEEDDSDSESDTESDDSDEQSTLVTESSQLGLIVKDVIASLLKLSLVITKLSRRAKFTRSSREAPYDTRQDILHAYEMFPHASENTRLMEKLGKANAQRRQWLSYRQKHREKLATTFCIPGMSMSDIRSRSSVGPRSESGRYGQTSPVHGSSNPRSLSYGAVENSTLATSIDERLRESNRGDNVASETLASDSRASTTEGMLIATPQPPAGFDEGPEHNDVVKDDQIPSIARFGSQPLQEISASACPLCDYDKVLRERYRQTGPITIKAKQFMHHLGRHLEQISLFALPKYGSAHYDNGDEEQSDGSGSEKSVSSNGDLEDAHNVEMSELANKSPQEILERMDLASGSDSQTLKEAPRLALGWLPPQVFTPPKHYFGTDDPEMLPRREESMFGGDVFTPGWVRGPDNVREGYCARCEEGHWVNIPNGTYEYHLTYLHGLPSSGVPLPRPSTIREVDERRGVWEGYCEHCSGWRVLRKTSKGWNWFRHYLTEHKSVLEPQCSPTDQPLSTRLPKSALISFQEALALIRSGESETYKDLLRSYPQLVQQRGSDSKTLLHHASAIDYADQVDCTVNVHKSLSYNEARSAFDLRDSDGLTPMMLAAGQGNEHAVEVLLKAGVNVNATTENGQTALDFAANAGYQWVAEMLLNAGADITNSSVFRGMYLQATKRRAHSTSTEDQPAVAQESEKEEWNDLLLGASEARLDKIEKAIRDGLDVESVTPDGRNALMLAGRSGSEEAMSFLISMGANVDTTDMTGWTVLMQVVSSGNKKLTQLLLSRGAEINHFTPECKNAISEAVQNHHLEVLKSLVEAGADLESRSMDDWTPLMHACYNGDLWIVKYLLVKGAHVESTSQRDESPMLLAAARGHLEVCKVLVQAGALPETTWAAKKQSEELSSYVQTSIERTSLLGWTPLMVACQGGHIDIVRYLLSEGGNLETKSPFGKTALAIARETGRSEIVELLQNFMKK